MMSCVAQAIVTESPASKATGSIRSVSFTFGSHQFEHLLENSLPHRERPEQRRHVASALGVDVDARFHDTFNLGNISLLDRPAKRNHAGIGEEVLGLPFESFVRRGASAANEKTQQQEGCRQKNAKALIVSHSCVASLDEKGGRTSFHSPLPLGHTATHVKRVSSRLTQDRHGAMA